MPVQLEERAKQFVNEQDGQVLVDWKSLAKAERSANISGDNRFRSTLDNILQFLHEKGILAYECTPKTYFATGFEVPLHPRLSESSVRYSFKDEQTARDYYSNFFKDAQYGIILHQRIGDVEKSKD